MHFTFQFIPPCRLQGKRKVDRGYQAASNTWVLSPTRSHIYLFKEGDYAAPIRTLYRTWLRHFALFGWRYGLSVQLYLTEHLLKHYLLVVDTPSASPPLEISRLLAQQPLEVFCKDGLRKMQNGTRQGHRWVECRSET